MAQRGRAGLRRQLLDEIQGHEALGAAVDADDPQRVGAASEEKADHGLMAGGQGEVERREAAGAVELGSETDEDPAPAVVEVAEGPSESVDGHTPAEQRRRGLALVEAGGGVEEGEPVVGDERRQGGHATCDPQEEPACTRGIAAGEVGEGIAVPVGEAQERLGGSVVEVEGDEVVTVHGAEKRIRLKVRPGRQVRRDADIRTRLVHAYRREGELELGVPRYQARPSSPTPARPLVAYFGELPPSSPPG